MATNNKVLKIEDGFRGSLYQKGFNDEAFQELYQLFVKAYGKETWDSMSQELYDDPDPYPHGQLETLAQAELIIISQAITNAMERCRRKSFPIKALEAIDQDVVVTWLNRREDNSDRTYYMFFSENYVYWVNDERSTYGDYVKITVSPAQKPVGVPTR